MSDQDLALLLEWFMCSDPWPQGLNRERIETMLNRESATRGFSNWVVAYHEMESNRS